MDFLGVGPLELMLILIVALIVIGPKDIAKTGTTIGRWLNNLIQSDTWKAVQKTSKELRQLPTNLMREANLEKILAENKSKPVPRINSGTWQGQIRPINNPENKPAAEPGIPETIQPPVIIPTPGETGPTAMTKPVAAKQKATNRKTGTPKKKNSTRKTGKTAPRKKSNA
jgi:Sec-independent protein translocase protein TatA